MTKEDYIKQIRDLDDSYYDEDLSDWSFKELKDLIESIKCPYFQKQYYEEHTSSFGEEEILFYENRRRKRRRAYQC